MHEWFIGLDVIEPDGSEVDYIITKQLPFTPIKEMWLQFEGMDVQCQIFHIGYVECPGYCSEIKPRFEVQMSMDEATQAQIDMLLEAGWKRRS